MTPQIPDSEPDLVVGEETGLVQLSVWLHPIQLFALVCCTGYSGNTSGDYLLPRYVFGGSS